MNKVLKTQWGNLHYNPKELTFHKGNVWILNNCFGIASYAVGVTLFLILILIGVFV